MLTVLYRHRHRKGTAVQTSRRPIAPRRPAETVDSTSDPVVHQDGLRGPTRALLMLFGALTALAVVALFGGSGRTDEAFAWTIQPPLSAAFLGAGYASGCLLVLLTLRAGTWRQARWPLATILVFAVLTLVATLVHLDRFHLPGDTPLATAAAWFWLVVYVVVPVGMAVVMVDEERRARQHRTGAPPQTRQPWWFAGSLRVQGLLLGVAGLALFLGVDRVVSGWPWALTPLVAKVTAAWLLAFAVAAVMAVREDVAQLGPASAGYLVFGAGQLLAVAVHHGDVAWGGAAATYLVVAAWVTLTGAAGLLLGLRDGR